MSETQFLITRDQAGVPAYGLHLSNLNWSFNMTSGEEATFVMPSVSSQYTVIFRPTLGKNFWFGIGQDAIAPPSSTTPTATSSVQNPQVINVPRGSTMRFYTDDSDMVMSVTAYVSAS